MTSGIERAHVYPDVPEEPATDAEEESLHAFEAIYEHRELIIETFRLDTDTPYILTPADLLARKQQMAESMQRHYHTDRTTSEIGSLILATVPQMEAEFRKQTLLDIGAGQGRLGQALHRNAKTKVTFLDRDPAFFPNIPKRFGDKVEADGRAIPRDDESFRKVMSALSSVHWSETPAESVQALNEAIRVAEIGGSSFIIPLITSISQRRQHLPLLRKDLDSRGDIRDIDRAMAAWSMQDLALINSLFRLAEEGYCGITWSNHLARIGDPPADRELYSIIVDKLKSIPHEIYAQNLADAEQLMGC